MVKQTPSEEASIHDEINVHELPAAEFIDAFMEETQPLLEKDATLPSIDRIDRTIQGLERFAQVYAVQSRRSIDSGVLIWMGKVEDVLLPNLLGFMNTQLNAWDIDIHDLNQELKKASASEKGAIYKRINTIQSVSSYMRILLLSGTAVQKYFHRLTHVY